MGQRRKRLPTTEEMKRRSSSMSSPSKGERSFQLFAKLAKKGDPLRITRPERLSPIALFVGPLRLLNLRHVRRVEAVVRVQRRRGEA